ncbi:hypothetical protein [Thermodesulfovibrio yellowstonii]|uniref:hypothetical protein n=1 Tax=Thermodesulfovibrio yellowstonii TaxID=28262 RepID=UPI0003F951DF|nr:hypothetical protein [Thermodesulfovibrio islandicus]
MNTIIVIGLIGKEGSGTAIAADYLAMKHGFAKCSFETFIKNILVMSKMCNINELYIEKTIYSRWLTLKLIQILREYVDENYLVKKMLWKIGELLSNGHKKIVIEDVKFENEVELIKLFHGKLIKIIKPSPDPLAVHISPLEKFIDILSYDFILKNNGNLKEFYAQIDNIIFSLQEV